MTKSDVRFMIAIAMFAGAACIAASAFLGFLLNEEFGLRPWGWLAVIPAAGYWIWMLPKAVRDWL